MWPGASAVLCLVVFLGVLCHLMFHKATNRVPSPCVACGVWHPHVVVSKVVLFTGTNICLAKATCRTTLLLLQHMQGRVILRVFARLFTSPACSCCRAQWLPSVLLQRAAHQARMPPLQTAHTIKHCAGCEPRAAGPGYTGSCTAHR